MRWFFYRRIKSHYLTEYPTLSVPHRTAFFNDTVVAHSRWTLFLPASGSCRRRLYYSFEPARPETLPADANACFSPDSVTISGERESG